MTPAKIFDALLQASHEIPVETALTAKQAFERIVVRAKELLDTQGAEKFPEAWQLYPNKVAKTPARNAWIRMDGDLHFDAIVKNVQWRLRSNEWNVLDLDRRRFIPHFSTYLNQRRWLDPMTVERTGAHRDF